MKRALAITCAGSAALATPVVLALGRAYPPTPGRIRRAAQHVAEHLGWLELRNGIEEAGTQ